MEAIILAGGQGTRLRSVVSDLPKPMAIIAGRPFLAYLFDYLASHRFDRLIVSTGFMHEKIEAYFGTSYRGMRIDYSREITPLGTGGAVKLALEKTKKDTVFVFNGDTFFAINIADLLTSHIQSQSPITIALKPMEQFERYGNVISVDGSVIAFEEKKYFDHGTINAGVYILESAIFNSVKLPEKFSFETDFLEKNLKSMKCNAVIADEYFIDIGVPSDYYKAGQELADVVASKVGSIR
ncbi:MAG: nucleotidyltransferase family protein [Sporomusaceae bacterium]|nr:nucleotidyltransferase family protein [Sporomusaceae bacterium]